MANCEQCENLKKPVDLKVPQVKKASDLKMVTQRHYLESWMAAADAMRGEEVFTDVVLICENRQLAAHSLVLAGSSPYFRAMLATPMLESNSGKIELKTLDFYALEVLVHFMYTGHVKLNDGESELLSAVMQASHMLQVDALFDYTIKVMAGNFSSEHFLEIWNTAEFYDQTQLLSDTKQKLAADFETVSSSNDFLNMTVKQLEEILILTTPNLAELTLQAILKWTKEDEENRRDHLALLLKHVNNNYLSDVYLKNLLSTEVFVQQNPVVSNFILSATLPHLCKPLPLWSTLKSSMLCFAKDSGLSRVYIQDSKWSEPILLTFPLTKDMSSVAYNGDVYFVGCKSSTGSNTDGVWKYSPSTNTHGIVLQLRIPVSVAVVIDLLGFIYVIGGFDTTQNSVPTPTKSVQRFNPVTKICEQVSSTLEAHWFPLVGQLLGFLYLIGSSGTIERYDPNINQWTKVQPLPVTVFGCCGAFGHGKCYVMANKRSPNELWVYDPILDTWNGISVQGKGPTEIKGRWTIRTNEPDHSVMMVRDKNNDLYCYNPGRNVWMIISPVSSAQLSFTQFCIVSTVENEQ